MKDDKAKFFAQYWGQKVQKYLERKDIWKINEGFHARIHESYLELTPLSEITDEHAIDVADILEGFGVWVGAVEYINVGIKYIEGCENHMSGAHSKIVDYLRSKGYALPWLNYSVEKQIELGWIKLKEQ